MIGHRAAAAAIAFGLVVTGSGSAYAALSHADRHHSVLGHDQPLLPGQSTHSSITVPAAPVPTHPYLQINSIKPACANDCSSAPRALGSKLTLTATADTGATWTSTLAGLVGRRALPGGTIAAGKDRTYQLTLSLPTNAGDAYEDLGVSAVIGWGGTPATTTTIGLVGPNPTGTTATIAGLGDSIAAGSSNGHGASAKAGNHHHQPAPPSPVAGPSFDDSVPLSGFDVFALLVLVAEILGFSTLLAAVRRRRRRHQ